MRNSIGLLFTIYLTLVSFVANCQNWNEILPKNGNCKVMMPGNPESTERIMNHLQYGKLTMHMTILQPEDTSDPNKIYMLSYTDYPIGTIHSDSSSLLDDYFESSREGIVANVQGTFLMETILDISGYPGREIRLSFKNGLAFIRIRNYLVKNRLYSLQTITLAGSNFNSSINKYFDSFTLITK